MQSIFFAQNEKYLQSVINAVDRTHWEISFIKENKDSLITWKRTAASITKKGSILDYYNSIGQ